MSDQPEEIEEPVAIRVIDTRDMAMIIMVTNEGEVTFRSSRSATDVLRILDQVAEIVKAKQRSRLN